MTYISGKLEVVEIQLLGRGVQIRSQLHYNNKFVVNKHSSVKCLRFGVFSLSLLYLLFSLVFLNYCCYCISDVVVFPEFDWRILFFKVFLCSGIYHTRSSKQRHESNVIPKGSFF